MGFMQMFDNTDAEVEREKRKNQRLTQALEEARKNLENEQRVNDSLSNLLREARAEMEMTIKLLDEIKKDPSYIEKEQAKQISELKRQASRAYECGRQDVFAEVGIWRLDAGERGNVLVRTEDGEIFELITGLEDVKESESDRDGLADDEIAIEDLLEKGA